MLDIYRKYAIQLLNSRRTVSGQDLAIGILDESEVPTYTYVRPCHCHSRQGYELQLFPLSNFPHMHLGGKQCLQLPNRTGNM